jgi:hypothetical protein
MADFLGDPNFPANAMRATSHGLKIRYFQGLYQDYSRLAFTRDEDRPIAIAGLEKRLQKAYNTKGGHGIFDDGLDGGLFHRSLLWCRGDDEEALRPIIFPVERRMKVPTWSWMAYQGGIRYADPPFEAALWEQTEIRPPWTRGNIESSETTDHNAELAITATVRDFDVAGRQRDEVKFVYDTERTESDGQRPQCVVVARSKEGVTNQEKQIYVLLVTATGGVSVKGEKIYKRAGAGIMLGKFIEFDNPGIPAKIV